MTPIGTLVIACGNRLRSDDGVALVAAEQVMGWQLPLVCVVMVQQLMPELIEEMKRADQVLFLDASVDPDGGEFQVRPLEPRKSRRLLGHHEAPENLLALLQDLEGVVPRAWLLSIGISSVAHGEGLTVDTARRLEPVLARLREFLADPSSTESN